MKERLFQAGAAALWAGLVLAGPGGVQAQPATGPQTPAQPKAKLPIADFAGEKAVSRSSRDSTLAFPFPAEVAEIAARGGQAVKKGDLIIRARDEEYRLQVELQKMLAESDLDVQKAQAGLEQAEVEYDAQVQARKQHSGSKLEEDRARTTVTEKKVELEIAKLQYEQQKVQLRLREAQLDRNYIRAPFDGRVDEVYVDVGEVKKDSDKIARVVSVNPLWIDVPTPTAQTIVLGLKTGDDAWVVLGLPGDLVVTKGKVIEVGAEADAASDLRRVRVELPNPKEHPAGLTAWVRFTPPTGEWARRIAPPEPAPKQTAEAPPK